MLYKLKSKLIPFGQTCEILKGFDFEKGAHKYTWKSDLVIKFDHDTILLFKVESIGNGGWQGFDECYVHSVHVVCGTRIENTQETVYLI